MTTYDVKAAQPGFFFKRAAENYLGALPRFLYRHLALLRFNAGCRDLQRCTDVVAS